MLVIRAENVNVALSLGIRHLIMSGVPDDSRNGPVLVYPTPVTTVYTDPTKRVLSCPVRDANPFFHLMEGLWMLAGRNDVEWINQFNSRIADYSDDGEFFHGAYGFRWRHWFGDDQLGHIAHMLAKDHTSRRAVLTMWDPQGDLWRFDASVAGGPQGKDVPCNTQIYFTINGGKLDMTVCNRSNDAIWGCYGANAVHMSMLQEYMAALIGVGVGVYYQMSNNLHIYTNTFSQLKLEDMMLSADINDHYRQGAKVIPMMNTPFKLWHRDLNDFMREHWEEVIYADPFFDHVAIPMRRAWNAYKKHGPEAGMEIVLGPTDWHVAGYHWLVQREKNRVGASCATAAVMPASAAPAPGAGAPLGQGAGIPLQGSAPAPTAPASGAAPAHTKEGW